MSTSTHLAVSNPGSGAANRKFPPEILSLIFKLAIKSSLSGSGPLDDSLGNKRNITNVCRYWRQVAYGTQTLWTSVSLSFLTPDDLDWIANILKLHFQHSGQRRLKICLAFTGEAKAHNLVNFSNLVHPSVDQDIIDNADRITRLSLMRLPPSMFTTWFDYMSTLSSLRTLEIDGFHEGYIDLSTNPSINYLILSWTPGPISVHGPNIRSLTLHCVPTDTCANLLFECPNLEKCYMTTPMRRDDTHEDDDLVQREIITFPNLKDLTWEFTNSPYDDDILEFLDPPALQNLYWKQEDRWTFTTPELTFFNRLPATLNYIDIETVYENDEDEEDNLLSLFPGRLQFTNLSFVHDTFKALVDSASYLVPSEERPDLIPFPELVELHLTSADPDFCDLSRDRLVAFLDVICRRVGPDRCLRILFCGNGISCKREELPRDIVEMLEKKYLVIVVDGDSF